MSDTTPQVGELPTDSTAPAPEAISAEPEVTAPAVPETTADQDDDALTIATSKLEKALGEVKSLRAMKNSLREQIAALESEKANLAKQADASTQAEARAAALEAQLRTERLSAAIGRQSAASKIADPELVARLLDPAQVSWDDAGQPANLADLVEALVAKHPVLVATPQSVPTGAVVAPARSAEPRSLDDLAGLTGKPLLNALATYTKRPRAA